MFGSTLLQNKQFIKLWINQILLQIGFNMTNFTALLVIDHTTSSRFSLAVFYAAMTLPAFVVGFLAGSIVDLYSRKKLIVASNIALAILFLAYSEFSYTYWGIIIIAFLASSVAQFFTPAEAATIPLIVKPKDLGRANAFFLFTGMGSVMIGYAIAGPLIQFFGGLFPIGGKNTFIFSAMLVLTGFLFTSTLKNIGKAKIKKIDEKIIGHAFTLTREVIAETKKNYRILVPIALLTLVEFNVGLLAILFIDYVKVYLVLPSTSTSYFLILPLILGLGLGIEMIGRVQKRWGRGKAIYWGALIFGIVILVLGIGGVLLKLSMLTLLNLRILTLVCAAFVGVAAVFIAVNARTILQENTPKEMLGRVFSLVTVGASAVTPIPILIVALITEKVDVTTVFIIFGATLTIISVIAKSIIAKKLNMNI